MEAPEGKSMGLLDFFKSGSGKPGNNAPALPNELTFKSGKAAIDYVAAYLKTDWKAQSLVVGLLGPPTLENGILSAGVLLPHGEGFLELPTKTAIKAVRSPSTGKVPLNNSSDIRHLDLKFGDLVSVILAGQDADFKNIFPETQGWIGFVVAKNSLTYSLLEGGWILERKYEL